MSAARAGTTSSNGRDDDISRQVAARPAVVVGARREDIEAAHAVPAIAVTYGYGSTDELVAADVFVGRPSDLPEAIERRLEQRTHL